jgi:hypothetical protein
MRWRRLGQCERGERQGGPWTAILRGVDVPVGCRVLAPSPGGIFPASTGRRCWVRRSPTARCASSWAEGRAVGRTSDASLTHRSRVPLPRYPKWQRRLAAGPRVRRGIRHQDRRRPDAADLRFAKESPRADKASSFYIGVYLREEIQAEALVRSIGNFARFLNTAALGNGEQVIFSAIARAVIAVLGGAPRGLAQRAWRPSNVCWRTSVCMVSVIARQARRHLQQQKSHPPNAATSAARARTARQRRWQRPR